MNAILRNTDGTLTVGFKNKIRRVEVEDTFGTGEKLVSKSLNGVCQHRTGKKLHPVRMVFLWDGNGYRLAGQYCCLNRQALLVDWLEDYVGLVKISRI